jgi:hypothetical protein
MTGTGFLWCLVVVKEGLLYEQSVRLGEPNAW